MQWCDCFVSTREKLAGSCTLGFLNNNQTQLLGFNPAPPSGLYALSTFLHLREIFIAQRWGAYAPARVPPPPGAVFTVLLPVGEVGRLRHALFLHHGVGESTARHHPIPPPYHLAVDHYRKLSSAGRAPERSASLVLAPVRCVYRICLSTSLLRDPPVFDRHPG